MKRLFSLLFCLSLLSCQQQEEEVPANMIPQNKMVRILADIHTLEAQLETSISYPDTALMVFSKQQEEILKKYNVEPQQFRDTYKYYLTHLAEMDKLYEIVVDTLSVRESRARAEEKPEQ